MDSIELAKALPPRARTALYLRAASRALIPAMPWPVWMLLCSLSATLAMALAWHALGTGLPELSAMDLARPLALFIPALGLDALLRRMHPHRNRLGYLAIPALTALAFSVWIGLASGPAAKAEARAAAFASLSQSTQSAVDRIAELQSAQAPSKAISDGLKLAPSKSKKADPNIPKPITLPPLPVLSGPTPAAPAPVQAAHDSAEAETFEMATKAALSLIDEKSRASAREAKTIAASLMARPSSIQASRSHAKEAIEIFMQACAIALIGAALGAHVFGFGLSSTLLYLPRKALQGTQQLAEHAQTALRPTVATLLAPSASDLAELERRVKAYRDTQDDSRAVRISLDDAMASAMDEQVTLALSEESTHIETGHAPSLDAPTRAS